MARTPVSKIMNIDNYDDIRGRSTSPSKTSSRSPSISSTTSFIPYYKKIEINNNLLDKEFTEPVNSFQLLYNDNNRKDIPISEVTDNSFY